jgi:phosphoribosylaminoimidazole-succinocarboxamide synthase
VIDLTHLYTGKVRDLYEVDATHLLMVASDRLSAFDVVMNEPIVHKGRVLTALTNFWTYEFANEIPSALVTCDPVAINEFVPGFIDESWYHGRSMLVRRASMLPLECIVRARLAGQAFDEYREFGTVHRMPVRPGLKLTDAFEQPMFTPSTKAEVGHDVNIDLDEARTIVSREVLDQAMTLCLDLFSRASVVFAHAGLVLADTKFELGYVDDQLVVCDEVLTPDSSRIWPAEEVRSGEVPPSFDKQPFRDWLNDQHWDRRPPAPTIPPDVLSLTSARYVAAYERTTGRLLRDWYGA